VPGTEPIGPICQNAWYRCYGKRCLEFLFPIRITPQR
jgi:hypothetical protein